MLQYNIDGTVVEVEFSYANPIDYSKGLCDYIRSLVSYIKELEDKVAQLEAIIRPKLSDEEIDKLGEALDKIQGTMEERGKAFWEKGG
jgi:hypothetical protein